MHIFKEATSKPSSSKKTKVSINNVNTKASKNDSLTFAVLGDVHENDDKLQNAINDLHDINDNMDVVVLNGDNVDQSLKSQYDAIKNTLDKNRELLPKIIIKNIRNHDYFDYAKGRNKPEDVQIFIDIFKIDF